MIEIIDKVVKDNSNKNWSCQWQCCEYYGYWGGDC